MTYPEWIAANVPQDTGGYGKCREHAAAMARAFPGLRKAAGFYHCPSWGRREHWWCVEEDTGRVVDPTAGQFPSRGAGEYEELDLDDPADRARVPTGVCMDCGEPVYRMETFCSNLCEERTMAYLGMERTERGTWRNATP